MLPMIKQILRIALTLVLSALFLLILAVACIAFLQKNWAAGGIAFVLAVGTAFPLYFLLKKIIVSFSIEPLVKGTLPYESSAAEHLEPVENLNGIEKIQQLQNIEKSMLASSVPDVWMEDLASYRAAGVEEYEFMATLDARTCKTCADLDGKIFKVKDAKPGVNYPPMHDGCRCTTVEYDPEDKLDWINSGEPVPKSTTFQEWQQSSIDTYKEISSKIPPEILNLLWFKNGALANCPDEKEPSAIDVHLPLQIFLINQENLEDIGYFPSYAKLSPKQRYIYLNWLCDVTQPIAIGYVFIFYYGLERYLFTEKYESALKMMSNLRLKYDNKSFLTYSANAILIGCALYHRPDLLLLDCSKLHKTLLLFIRTYVFRSLSAQSIMDTCTQWGFTNKRYITGHPDRFLIHLQTHIYDLYQQDTVPISQTDYGKAKKPTKSF